MRRTIAMDAPTLLDALGRAREAAAAQAEDSDLVTAITARGKLAGADSRELTAAETALVAPEEAVRAVTAAAEPAGVAWG